ncbi:MAG: M99 family carboxypeptidase catalytic domain-containing protein [Aliarcobacter sp.]|nr:M99 family carboxypeptidase catalytic domain-containing protein [Aliarcobacter sp.]
MRFFILFFPLIFLFASNTPFDIYKKETNPQQHTLLIIGGIHGDEPGGYFAPAVLEKYYKIKSGNLWIIPNLNVDSILANTRGIYGDMNRKFNVIEKNDNDLLTINRIKEIILEKRVDLILNLHDGFGFYRDIYEDSVFNPNSWGQATIIDQEKIDEKFGNLGEIANQVNKNVNNEGLYKDFHTFGVKNTQTKEKDEQMQQSLTYFAVTHNKPAFAIETSKNITELTHKVIYQLKAIEEFMKIMNIEFERDFDINNYDEVQKRVNDFGEITINDNISFDLTDIKNNLRFVPLKKENNKFDLTHTLAKVKFDDNKYEIHIGNMKVCDLYPQIFDVVNTQDKIKILVDGKEIETTFGNQIDINNDFKIEKSDFRVNIIGFSKDKIDSEDDILIKKSDIQDNYSIDNNKSKYRAEFYKDGKFYGMIILNFLNN